MPDTPRAPFDLARLRDRPLLLGVVHLPPLPGSPRHPGLDAAPVGALVDHARRDAEAILQAGFDGYVVENFGDAPFFADRVPPHVLTILTRVALALPRRGAVVGANVLRNDGRGALAVALGAELDFVRVNVLVGAAVTDQGVVTGRAAELMRERAALAPTVAVVADVDVKHASPLGARYSLEDAAKETAYRGLADALIVTGSGTGQASAPSDLARVVDAVPDRCVLIGSGVTEATVAESLTTAHGVIVGTSLKENGEVHRPVDPGRVRRFVDAARGR